MKNCWQLLASIIRELLVLVIYCIHRTILNSLAYGNASQITITIIVVGIIPEQLRTQNEGLLQE